VGILNSRFQFVLISWAIQAFNASLSTHLLTFLNSTPRWEHITWAAMTPEISYSIMNILLMKYWVTRRFKLVAFYIVHPFPCLRSKSDISTSNPKKEKNLHKKQDIEHFLKFRKSNVTFNWTLKALVLDPQFLETIDLEYKRLVPFCYLYKLLKLDETTMQFHLE
jgi:hypothetical protein